MAETVSKRVPKLDEQLDRGVKPRGTGGELTAPAVNSRHGR
jgi:hypothetical protein